MTEREATDAEMLAAVERWAKARGFGRGQAGEWLVDTETGRVVIVHGPSRTSWTVDPHTAVLWALLVEAGITVDVGRCPKCAPFNDAHRGRRAHNGSPITWGGCPDCNGTGRDMREVARLVLDAAPIDNACPHASTINGHCIDCLDTGYCQGGPETLPGNSQARDHVDVCATKLQTLGSPIGLWSALWLAVKRDFTADMIERRIFADREGGTVVLRHGYVPAGVRLPNEVPPLTDDDVRICEPTS